MKAIIIQDSDAANLLDLLKLQKWNSKSSATGIPWLRENASKEEMVEAIHGQFHFIVCRWLQEQGAQVVR